jgi:hypothetical protein
LSVSLRSLRAHVVPSDSGAVGRYRAIFPAEALAQSIQEPFVQQRRGLGGEVPVYAEAEGAEVLVVNRPVAWAVVEQLRAWRGRGCAIVVDVDDDYGAHPVINGIDNDACVAACEIADMVTATTQRLLDVYATHGRARLLPNRLHESTLGQPRDSDGQTLGWAGVVISRENDFEGRGAAIADAAEDAGWRILVIGPGYHVERAFDGAEVESTGFLDFDGYHQALNKLDIGVVPLADNDFSAAKSALKGLEYAAHGVPFVASPSQAYEELAAAGVGLLAATPRDWRRELKRLMGDSDLRAELAAHGVEFAAQQTYGAYAEDWSEAWDAAVKHRQGDPAA